MLAGKRGLSLLQEAGVDEPEERRVLGPGRARRTRVKDRGGRERARDSGAVAALPESGASRPASSWGAGGGAGGSVSGTGPAGSWNLANPRGSALVGLDPEAALGAGPGPAAGPWGVTGQREGCSCRGCSRRACRAWGRGVELLPLLSNAHYPPGPAPRKSRRGLRIREELTFDPSAGLTLSGSAPRRERSLPREVGPLRSVQMPWNGRVLRSSISTRQSSAPTSRRVHKPTLLSWDEWVQAGTPTSSLAGMGEKESSHWGS